MRPLYIANHLLPKHAASGGLQPSSTEHSAAVAVDAWLQEAVSAPSREASEAQLELSSTQLVLGACGCGWLGHQGGWLAGWEPLGSTNAVPLVGDRDRAVHAAWLVVLPATWAISSAATPHSSAVLGAASRTASPGGVQGYVHRPTASLCLLIVRSATTTSSVPVLVQARRALFHEQKFGIWHITAAFWAQSCGSTAVALHRELGF
jgi:hypothetical protein